MAAMKAVAAATTSGPAMSGVMAAAPFPSRPRNLILSSSSFPRWAFLPRRLPRLAMRSTRIAMDRRLSVTPGRRHGGVIASASAAGRSQFSAWEDENPYEILGISPLDGFEQAKMAYKRRKKDAESNCDREYLVKLERAYDMVMLDQLLERKKGVTYGSIQVSKDIRYADYQPIIPWGPRYSRSTVKDLRINMTISAVFIMCISTLGHADWKPLQFLCFAYFYRILEKLKATEPAITPIYNEYGEIEGRGIHMAKRVLRSLGLVLGSILAISRGLYWTCKFFTVSWTIYSICCSQFSGADCDYGFIRSTLHLSLVLSIAIGAGLEKTCSIDDTYLPQIWKNLCAQIRCCYPMIGGSESMLRGVSC